MSKDIQAARKGTHSVDFKVGKMNTLTTLLDLPILYQIIFTYTYFLEKQ